MQLKKKNPPHSIKNPLTMLNLISFFFHYFGGKILFPIFDNQYQRSIKYVSPFFRSQVNLCAINNLEN